MAEYQDRWITCTETEIQVRAYYFPWGTKRTRYEQIHSAQLVEMGTLTGRARIWGTNNPRYWASLDPKRPGKKAALVLDLGRRIHPFLTPDDVAAVETVLRSHGVEIGEPDGRRHVI